MQKAANQRFEFLQKIGKSVAASESGLTIWKKKKKGNEKFAQHNWLTESRNKGYTIKLICLLSSEQPLIQVLCCYLNLSL